MPQTKKHSSALCMIGLVALSLSCSTLEKRRCNPSYASQQGRSDASRGHIHKPGLAQGNICKENYSKNHFLRDYMSGFSQEQSRICTMDHARSYGSSEGRGDASKMTSESLFDVCQGIQKPEVLKSEFRKNFKLSYCQVSRAQSLGNYDAGNLNQGNPRSVFQMCTSNLKSLVKTYKKAYRKRLAQECSVMKVNTWAQEDAKAGKDLASGMGRFQVCPKKDAQLIMSTYQASYYQMKNQLHQQEQLRLERERIEVERQKIEAEKKRMAQEQAYRQQEIAVINSPSISKRNIRKAIRKSLNPTESVFYHDGQRVLTYCEVQKKKRQAIITVVNDDRSHLSLTKRWKIQYYNKKNIPVGSETTTEILSIWPGDQDSFKDRRIPKKARSCRASVNS